MGDKSIFAKPCSWRRRRCYLNVSADARFARLPITEKQRISCLLHAAVLMVSAKVLESDTVKQSLRSEQQASEANCLFVATFTKNKKQGTSD